MITRRGFLSTLSLIAGGRPLWPQFPERRSLAPAVDEGPSEQPATAPAFNDVLREVFGELERAYAQCGNDACRDLLARRCPSYRCHLCPLRWGLVAVSPTVPVKLGAAHNIDRLVLLEPTADTRAPLAAAGHSAQVAAAWRSVRAGDPLALSTAKPKSIVLDLLSAPPLCPRKVAAGQLDGNEWMRVCRRAAALSDAGNLVIVSPPGGRLVPGYRHLGRGRAFLRRAAAEAVRFTAIVGGKVSRFDVPGNGVALFRLGHERPIGLHAVLSSRSSSPAG